MYFMSGNKCIFGAIATHNPGLAEECVLSKQFQLETNVSDPICWNDKVTW